MQHPKRFASKPNDELPSFADAALRQELLGVQLQISDVHAVDLTIEANALCKRRVVLLALIPQELLKALLPGF